MRNPWFDPVALMRLQMRTSIMMMEAGAVIWLRCLGMAGSWNTHASERTRMITEKHGAFTRSAGAALTAIAGGRSAEQTLSAALRPIGRTTRSNVRRLTRRGPAKF